MEWSNLPSEILFCSLKQLDLESLMRCTRVCKNWRTSVYDDHLWKNLFSINFSHDPSIPYEGQSWKQKYKHKSDILNAIRTSNVTLHNIIANHEAHMENGFIGDISMFGNNVIASTTMNTENSYSPKVLGCHAKNIYTGEVSKQLGKSWYSKAIGNHLLSFDVTNKLSIEWNAVKVTKIPSDISEMKFSDNKVTWDERQFKTAIFNADPTFTTMLAVGLQRQSVLFNWLTMEKVELGERIQGRLIALHQNTIVTTQRGTAHVGKVFVYQNLVLEHEFDFFGQDEVYSAVLTERTMVYATMFHIVVCNRQKKCVEYMLKRTNISLLFLFEDLLAFWTKQGLTFFDISARKEVNTFLLQRPLIKTIIRHSPTEFVLQTEHAVVLMRCETKVRRTSVMHVPQSGALNEITVKSSDLLGTALEALKATGYNVGSSFVLKKPSSGKRYIMLFNLAPAGGAKPNVKANELLQEYFRVSGSYVYMPHCPYVASGLSEWNGHSLVLDRDLVVKGDVLIYHEQLVDGKMQLCKPEKWPMELYTKTIEHQNNDNNKGNKQSTNKTSTKKTKKK